MSVMPPEFQGEAFFLFAKTGQSGGMAGEWQRRSGRLRAGNFRMMIPGASCQSTSFHSDYRPMSEETAQQAADRRLLSAVAQGEQAAFASLYDRLSGPLYSLCLRMTGEAQEAEDILQEACVTIWRRAASYDPAKSSVFSWAVHLTRCKVIDHLRARGRRLRVLVPAGNGNGTEGDHENDAHPPGVELPVANAGTAADDLDRSEQAARVRRVLEALPTEQSQAIQLAFFADLSHHEISSRLEQPLGTIKARIRRGLLKLRDGLNAGAV